MDQAPATKTDRVTIAIKMPAPLQERILSFPMIHLLREAYPEADLHFICPEHKIEMLFALPFEGFWHPWKEDEVESFLDAHRYVANLNMPPVDIYLCLGDTLKELAVGTFLDAKKRIGFAEGWKRWFTTLAVKRPLGHHISEDFFYLFKEFTNRRIPDQMKVKGKELPPYYKEDEGPYLAVDLWPFDQVKLDDFWFEYFSMHEGKRFILFSSQEEAKAGLLAERLIQRLPKTNKYELFLSPDWIDLGKMLAHAKGLVARAGASISYATYLGTDTLAIYETGEPRKDAPIPFYANWRLMDLRDPTIANTNQIKTEVIKPRAQVDPVQLFQQTSEMFHF